MRGYSCNVRAPQAQYPIIYLGGVSPVRGEGEGAALPYRAPPGAPTEDGFSRPFQTTSGQGLILPWPTSRQVEKVIDLSRSRSLLMLNGDVRMYDRSAVRTPGLGQLTRAAIRSGLRYGRTFRPNALGATSAAGIAGLAAIMSGRGRGRRVARRVVRASGPSFNPGGAGGYVVKKSKGKKRKRKAFKLSPKVKEAVSKLINKKSRHWDPIQNLTFDEFFGIRTTTDYPMVPASSAIANNCVGWYTYGLKTITELKALIDAAYRKDAYAVSGTSVVRNVPFGLTGDGEQKEFVITQNFKFLIRNNSSQQSVVDLFGLKSAADTSYTPTDELQRRYNEAYVLDTGVIAGTDPQSIVRAFSQQFWTPNQKQSDWTTWHSHKSEKMVLNPGDEATFTFSGRTLFQYNQGPVVNYCSQVPAVLIRIQGSLSHSNVDQKLVHFSQADCDVRCVTHTDVKVRDALFTGQKRIKNNVAGAFGDDVVAGDAVQHSYDV